MRPISWFNNKSELKRYFQSLFSPDVFSRHSIEYVLERYFPRPQTNRTPTYVASPPKKNNRPKPNFSPELGGFTGKLVEEIERRSKTIKRLRGMEDDKDVFLKYMFGF